MTEHLQQLHVSELFYSIQGESTWQGLPCLFIRLVGCNLRCRYCDSRYTWEEPGITKPLADILDWVRACPESAMVEITGGEPLLQPAVYPLMRELVRQGRRVLLETNGSLSLSQVPDEVHIIMDVKCPESGMTGHNREKNMVELAARRQRGCQDEIKFVLSSEADFHWARTWVETGLPPGLSILFSPVQPLLTPQALALLLLAHHLPARLHLQLHALIWPEKTRAA